MFLQHVAAPPFIQCRVSEMMNETGVECNGQAKKRKGAVASAQPSPGHVSGVRKHANEAAVSADEDGRNGTEGVQALRRRITGAN